MNDAPNCPTHGTPMRAGNYGFFCPKKNADGSYCTHKVKTTTAAAPTVPAETAVPHFDHRDQSAALACAALEFSGRLHAGSGASPQEAIEAAVAAYIAMKAVS